MKKMIALFFAMPCLLFAEGPSSQPINEEDANLESLFSDMDKEDLSMIDELDDEEARKLFQEGAITMGDEESAAFN